MKTKISELPKVSKEDHWRAFNRALYNRSAGKQGAWLRARHAVKVPKWFIERLMKLGYTEENENDERI